MVSARMALVPALLLAAAVAALAWFTWRDRAEYARFKLLTETAGRQRRYRAWLVTAFLLFFVGSLGVLGVTGRLAAVIREPTGFLRLTAALRRALPSHLVSPELLGGMVSGLAIAVVAITVLSVRRGAQVQAVQLGDINALLPRNGAETLWTLLLSINAGVSEELFFRLTLPLLLALLTGNLVVAFAVAAAVFGFVHIYQGWTGVLATGFLGLALSALYLASGSLIAAMAAHAILDLFGLVVRPTLVRMLRRR